MEKVNQNNSKKEFGFPKGEHLKQQKKIELLFKEGHSLYTFPIRLFWLEINQSELEEQIKQSSTVEFGVSVSKKRFAKAVDRNRIKRQLREAYRQNKTALIEKANNLEKQLIVMVIYVGKEKASYLRIEKGVITLLEIVCRELDMSTVK